MEFQKAIELIRSGDEIGYLSAINESKGFLRKIFNNRLKGIINYDEWESEALDVLVKTIRQYGPENNTKFSTYFYKALNNKAIDLIRKYYGKKNSLKRMSVSSEYLFDNGFEKADSNKDEAFSWMVIKEAINKLDVGTPLRKEAYLKLFDKNKKGKFQEESIQRMHKTMYREVKRYLNENKSA